MGKNNKMLDSTFKKIDIDDFFIDKLNQRNIHTPTKIQFEVIPRILKEEDVIAQSKTGTGKTIAYLLPLLQIILKTKTNLLIIAPTNELVSQIFNELLYYKEGLEINSILLKGGEDINKQISALKKDYNIIVGVPGRILKLVDQGYLKLNLIKKLVIDEADFIIDLGFLKDLKQILSLIKNIDQMMIFSATLTNNTKRILDIIHNQKYGVRVDAKNRIPENIENYFIPVIDEERENTLLKLMNIINPFLSIIFVRTKEEAKYLFNKLKKLNFLIGSLYGDLTPSQRKRSIKDFKSAKIQYLVATDLASRGLDVESITQIINYTLPLNELDYLHRAGRTGRMNEKGEVYTLCNELDEGYLKKYAMNLDFKLLPVKIKNNKIEILKDYEGVKPRLNLNDIKKQKKIKKRENMRYGKEKRRSKKRR